MLDIAKKKFDELYDIILDDDGVPDLLGAIQMMNHYIHQFIKVDEQEDETEDEKQKRKSKM